MSSPSPQPPARTQEQLRNHFEVERELAGRLRKSTREERSHLYGTLYDELFSRVPDHPRWTRLESEEIRQRNVAAQMKLVREYLRADSTLVEFAPGNGWLGFEAAKTAQKVIGVDISNQLAPNIPIPANYQHVVYDGYRLDLPDNIAEIAFSFQFLEHLHPDDVGPHFELVHRLLKPGGVYVFDTPHRYSGPHDISRSFTNELVCFHFQEWTHRQMRALLAKHGFKTSYVFRMGRTQRGVVFNTLVDTLELLLAPLPHGLRRTLCKRLFPAVTMVAVKG
jgi:SAM-dependent methyltransferase